MCMPLQAIAWLSMWNRMRLFRENLTSWQSTDRRYKASAGYANVEKKISLGVFVQTQNGMLNICL